eukprot:2319467-Pleurochrysis_carterae.AAC.3
MRMHRASVVLHQYLFSEQVREAAREKGGRAERNGDAKLGCLIGMASQYVIPVKLGCHPANTEWLESTSFENLGANRILKLCANFPEAPLFSGNFWRGILNFRPSASDGTACRSPRRRAFRGEPRSSIWRGRASLRGGTKSRGHPGRRVLKVGRGEAQSSGGREGQTAGCRLRQGSAFAAGSFGS